MSLLVKNLIYILWVSFILSLSACGNDDMTSAEIVGEAGSVKAVEEFEAEVKQAQLELNEANVINDDIYYIHKKLKALAMQGNVEAQRQLGNNYFYGSGIPTDLGEAARWLEAAAESGDADAQHSIAMMYNTGEGVDEDIDKAREWYLKSATQGYDLAQLHLAQAYALGYNNDRDYVKAAEWATKAALQENGSAQKLLASFYKNGSGVRQNKTIAKEWYSKSCSNGSEYSCAESNRLSEEGY